MLWARPLLTEAFITGHHTMINIKLNYRLTLTHCIVFLGAEITCKVVPIRGKKYYRSPIAVWHIAVYLQTRHAAS